MTDSVFAQLESDGVFLTASLASDVRTLWRALARTQEAREVSRSLASDPFRIRLLAAYVEEMLARPYDKTYRHPCDAAICTALVVLEQSPISEARNLFARLRVAKQPSVVWVRRMAEYCDQRFAECNRPVVPGGARYRAPGKPLAREVPAEPIRLDTAGSTNSPLYQAVAL